MEAKVTVCKPHGEPRKVKAPTKIKVVEPNRIPANTPTIFRKTGKFTVTKKLTALADKKLPLEQLFK